MQAPPAASAAHPPLDTVPGFAEPESDDEMSDDDTWRSRLTWAGLHWPRRDVGVGHVDWCGAGCWPRFRQTLVDIAGSRGPDRREV